MTLHEIKHRWDGTVLFSLECETFKECFQAYIKDRVAAGKSCGPVRIAGKDLSGTDFEDSRFEDSSFEDSSFEDSSFEDSRFVRSRFVRSRFVRSRFVRSRFVGSRFEDSSFEDSRFVRSSFEDSSFEDSSFEGSRFEYSSFVRSSFVGSSFEGSRFDNPESTLSGLDLLNARDDIWKVLATAPSEVHGLRMAITEGRIDGTTYKGECACLVGTLANARHCSFDSIPGLKPDPFRPAEQFFLSIRKGDTPENSYFSKLACQWVDEWIADNPQHSVVANS